MAVPTTQLPTIQKMPSFVRRALAERASSISPENHTTESIMMDPQKLLRSAMPVRLMSTGCWSAALDDSISDGKEHVQSNPCHPVQEVLGWTPLT